MSGVGPQRRNTYDHGAPANYVAGLGRGAIGFTTRSDIGPARAAVPPGADGLPVPVGRGGGIPISISHSSNSSLGIVGGPPPGYIPGAGRGNGEIGMGVLPGMGRGSGTAGAGGFGRERDENEDYGDYSESNYDEFSGYSGSLFNDTPYDKDDEEADNIYESIDDHMDGRRKRRRELRVLEDMKKARKERPKISDQFADLKADLSGISSTEWENIPEIGDYSLKYKASQKKQTIFTPMPDHIIDGARQAGATVGALEKNGDFGGLETPIGKSGVSTDISGLSEARGTVLSLKLDKMSDSVSGQTMVDPKGYLTDLNSLKITSDAEIGDIKKARLLLRSVTMTNPKHGPGWIAASRLEEVAGKLVSARKIIKQGCESCPDQEDVWLEAARLQTPDNAKTVLANAVRHVPTSVKIWMQAANLEHDDASKKLVLRRALEFIPNSVKLWKAAIELEEVDDARIMLGRAVECVPQSVDMWLALARLETTHETARATLNKARQSIPSDPAIWIAAAKLEEAHDNLDRVDHIIQAALKSLSHNQVVIDREHWLEEAIACEQAGSPGTCATIVRCCLDIGVEPEDRKRTWMDDAESCLAKKSPQTAKAIYAHALKEFPGKKSIWLRAASLEKKIGTPESLQLLLQKAVTYCPQAEVLWLMAAKESWLNGSVENARNILRQAFSANSNSEQIWLAAVKLEWENDEYVRARALLARARDQAPTERVWMKSILLERELKSSDEEAMLQEAIKLYPSFAKFYMMLGQYYQSTENQNKARDVYRQGLQHCPSSFSLWKLAALHEEKTTSVTKARSLLELSRLKNPKTPELWLEAIRLEYRNNNEKGANNLLAKALQECPDAGLLWAELIMLAPRPQQRSKSVDALKRCDNDPHVVIAVARLFWTDRKYAKTRKWFNRAVTLDPDLGDAWAYYYKFELAHGTESEQQDVLQRCITAEPHHGEKWCAVSKSTSNRRLNTEGILQKVVLTI